MEPPTDDYADLTVEEVKERVREGVDAAAVLAYEGNHKDRITLKEWLETQYIESTGREDTLDDPEEVLVANQRVGHIAGMHFDAAHQTCVVTLTPRIERAVESGDLRILNHE